MATQIADATNCITITTNGVVEWTIPKRGVALEIKDTALRFHKSGAHVTSVEYSAVTSPVAANIEALRTAVNNFLIS